MAKAKQNAKKDMFVKIGEEKLKMNRGIGFFKEIGILPKQTGENLEGIGFILMSLEMGEPFTALEVLKAGLAIHDVEEADIENYVFEEADIEKLCQELMDFFEQSAYKKMVLEAKKIIEKTGGMEGVTQEAINQSAMNKSQETVSDTTQA